MLIKDIVKRVNTLLAGEQLVYSQLEPFLDETIDDINTQLNSVYPAFSEIDKELLQLGSIDYNFFPDKYIRDVVCVGAAYKFFLMDEEGMQTADAYGQKYRENMFYMVRDFIDLVPREFEARNNGSINIHMDDCVVLEHTPFPLDIWSW